MPTVTERPNYTDEQVRAHVEFALALVAELDPPADLREAVFTKAVDLHSGKQIVVEQAAMPVDLSQMLGGRRH